MGIQLDEATIARLGTHAAEAIAAAQAFDFERLRTLVRTAEAEVAAAGDNPLLREEAYRNLSQSLLEQAAWAEDARQAARKLLDDRRAKAAGHPGPAGFTGRRFP